MARVDLGSLDGMRLSGNEEGGVGLECDAPECWRGGQAIAYYAGYGSPAYQGVDEVVQVDSIAGLVLAAITHRTSVHRDVPAAV